MTLTLCVKYTLVCSSKWTFEKSNYKLCQQIQTTSSVSSIQISGTDKIDSVISVVLEIKSW